MRILVLHNFYAQKGGEDRVVEAELDGLKARGHDARLFTLSSAELEGRPLRAAWETLLTAYNPGVAARLEGLAREWRPDVAHVHNTFPRLSLSVFRALSGQGVPVVQTLHNFRYVCAKATLFRAGQLCRKCTAGAYGWGVVHACFRNSRLLSAAYGLALAANRKLGLVEPHVRRFIAVSESVVEEMAAAGIPREKLAVKGHFLSADPGPRFTRTGPAVYVGRLSEEKGIDWLVDAWRGLPGRPLVVVGEGPLASGLKKNAPAGVEWVGFLADPERFERIQSSLFCVAPSLCPETFGLAVLEAFACGKPVVASAIGGLTGLVEDGRNGLLVAPGDGRGLKQKLEWMFAHPEECGRMGRNAREDFEEKHGKEANLDSLEALYQAVVDEEKTRK